MSDRAQHARNTEQVGLDDKSLVFREADTDKAVGEEKSSPSVVPWFSVGEGFFSVWVVVLFWS